ncbi:hypothetical protein [Micromonospora aurantiaca]|uniref:hypothetical protein n=1 Tax=Micromonospora aurantiaca (nom. illeg.) TaxID=47850 RepID=UPI00382D3B9F
MKITIDSARVNVDFVGPGDIARVAGLAANLGFTSINVGSSPEGDRWLRVSIGVEHQAWATQVAPRMLLLVAELDGGATAETLLQREREKVGDLSQL